MTGGGEPFCSVVCVDLVLKGDWEAITSTFGSMVESSKQLTFKLGDFWVLMVRWDLGERDELLSKFVGEEMVKGLGSPLEGVGEGGEKVF